MAGWSNSSLTGRLDSLRPPKRKYLFPVAFPSSLCPFLSLVFVCLCEKLLVRSDGGAPSALAVMSRALAAEKVTDWLKCCKNDSAFNVKDTINPLLYSVY